MGFALLGLMLAGCGPGPSRTPLSAETTAKHGSLYTGRDKTAPQHVSSESAASAPTSTSAAGDATRQEPDMKAVSERSPPSTDVGEDDVEIDPDAPTVQLIKPGAKPRQLLRYRVQPGNTETMVMKLSMVTEVEAVAVGADIPPMSQQIVAPTMSVTSEFEVTDVQPNGDFTMRFELVGADLTGNEGPSELADALRVHLQSMVGLKGVTTLTSRGILKSYDASIPDGLDKEVRSSVEGTLDGLRDLSQPLPVEPVGVGAIWEVTQSTDVDGIQVNQVSRVTLDERKGDRLHLVSQLTQTAPPQILDVEGQQVEVTSFSGSGTEETQSTLTGLVPIKSIGKGEVDTTSVIDGLAEMSAHISIETDIRRQ